MNKITEAIRTAIEGYKAAGRENGGGFSINITHYVEDDTYDADVAFSNIGSMTIWLQEGSDDAAVEKIWNCDAAALENVATEMKAQGWIDEA